MSQNTYEELQALIGQDGSSTTGPDEVCKEMIRHWCEAMEDTNPLYTNEEYAGKSKYGDIISPPMMVQGWSFPLVWPDGQEMYYRHPEKPSQDGQPDPLAAAFDKLSEAGFFGAAVTDNTLEFVRPLSLGDRVTMSSKLAGISPEKKTRVGNGHFVTVSLTYTNQRSETVCKQNMTVFRFKPIEM
ncbi:MaoC family dehydratase [Chloroflexota bacterium]